MRCRSGGIRAESIGSEQVSGLDLEVAADQVAGQIVGEDVESQHPSASQSGEAKNEHATERTLEVEIYTTRFAKRAMLRDQNSVGLAERQLRKGATGKDHDHEQIRIRNLASSTNF